MTSERRIEGPRNRLIAEWDPDTGEMTRCEFVDAEDDGTKATAEDHPPHKTEQEDPPRSPSTWPPIESAGDRLRGLGRSSFHGSSAWGD